MTKQWSDELSVFTRAVAGAAIFGIPLVMTMEMWWIGKTLSLWYLLLWVAVGFVANLGLAWVAGFRTDHSIAMSIDQAIDALAVGMVMSAVLMFSLNQLRFSDGLTHGAGMVILLAIPLSLGASVAREVFSNRTGRNGDAASDLSHWQGLAADIGATIIGGIFVGISIAPTDEVTTIAAGLSVWHVYAIIGITLLLSYVIVFASGFDEASPPGPWQHPITETVLAFMVSLLVAFAMLVMFNRISTGDPLTEILRQTVVFALPTTIGGAAGRLVI